jgi:hypothetical protein
MKRLAPLCVVCLALAGLAATSARAVGITGTVTGGAALSLSSPTSPSFGLTLNGTDQSPTYTLPVTAVDPRGTGTGWNLTITSTQFKDASAPTHTFPTTASTITSVTNGCTTGSTCTAATNSISYAAFTVPAAAVAPAPVKFFNSAATTGLGSMDVNASLKVFVPANTYAGTYTSTVTVSIVSGP